MTAVIHLIDTLVYAVRLSGVTTRRLATAYSLFQIISLVASTANLIQAPLLSSVVERTINTGLHGSPMALVESPFYQQQLQQLCKDIRLVIFSATAGTFLGVLATPAFNYIFTRVIFLFEEAGSIPRLIIFLSSPRLLARTLRKRPGYLKVLRSSLPERPRNIPLAFLAANTLVIGIWTTGVLSALYAGALLPDYRSTASLLSGLVNGVATILSAMIVDPTAAMITDQALRGTRDQQDVRQMVYYLCLTRVLGTILAQALFLPSAYLIKEVAQFIAGQAHYHPAAIT
ncbi:lipid II flippase Amj family protein [Desulfovirgula thermocuniculi]|uniref:lipid II flippase Amj family protein n=1 Tax=Desulfovirgula thermocuniculi TaxID=348842 RepID=UPI00041F67DA|nr:lipid II flippase Amj family protein [Desulfovirgula thermocuniculi]